ncbi:MAG: KH domain-containing protein [Elainellaceae cyanobacterium]
MSDPSALPSPAESTPNYEALLRFLIEPFLEQPATLSIDCEYMPTSNRVWLRVAFEESDRGRVFGRGGRNIQAIRTVLRITAQSAQQIAHLDVYGLPTEDAPRPAAPRSSRPTPPVRPRSRSAQDES